MEIDLVNLFGVAVVAFLVPFTLGFLPRARISPIAVEIIAGVIVGPAVLGWIEPDAAVQTIAVLGVAFLLFLAGMELDLEMVRGAPLRLGAIGFALSLVIALAGAVPLGLAGLILTPLLVAVALCSTSVGIVVPVLLDTGRLRSDIGRYTLAGGVAAEFGSIVLLGVLFAGRVESIVEGIASVVIASVALVVFAVVSLVLLWLVSRAVRWRSAMRVTARLDETTSQLRTRAAVMLVLGMAVIASAFGYEAILGTFIAGIFMGALIRDDKREHLYRTRLEAMGFGFFVPVFFVSTGMTLDVSNVMAPEELWKIGVFVVLLLAARGLPAVLYRHQLSVRGMVAVGLMQATNLSFIVVAVTVGGEMGLVTDLTASALVLAGLVSAIAFPPIAQSIIRHDRAEASGDGEPGTGEEVSRIAAADAGAA